ncbi:AIPR family protein [Methanosarcina sp. 1.H.A.2.2]|uniref:AIPR family protein n=1 Tax=Methanosarcina sp. 1.H.A.2.2 TaxID=1483601 RepID=UPI0006221045|nr:AIPR family protein [Methanosarcina sp. 1.H.A.2.2]KKH45795.1 hypothetical protein EO93_05010 [Methanosarcina sp. 1.H.A.2.2]
MNLDSEIEEFAKTYQQEIISQSQVEDEEYFREDKFTEIMMEDLCEADEIDNPFVCSHRSRGIKVNGYAISENESCLDLFISIYYGDGNLASVPKSDMNTAFKKIYNFYSRCCEGYHKDLEEASDVFDLASIIYDMKDNLTNVRLFLLTDGIAKKDPIDDEISVDVTISYHIWDLERLYRLKSSGNKREAIEIDFENDFGDFSCLPMDEYNPFYKTYLAIMPGNVLFKLYEKFGPRLLERNVRSFLQVRGNINKGIRETIIKEPYMFLAYNNGLSVTAKELKVKKSSSGDYRIKWAKDFQIVNGGQTTASIYNAVKKNNADVSDVLIPLKLTVLKEPERLDYIVPRISECANSQNKVSVADFSSNHPYHVKLEELSRTIWAPAKHGMQAQTRWYYERSRGQYLDEKGRENTESRKKAFEARNPNKQKFSKTDLAKYENTWDQLPHIVSRGAEKNFKDFMARLKERGDFKPDSLYFEHLIAKAILFKETEKIVEKQKYGGYRANIVTYTLSLIFYKTEKRINLDEIWRQQALTPVLIDTIVMVSRHVYQHIIDSPDGKNVTEWCKKEQCWKELIIKKMDLPLEIQKELIKIDKRSRNRADKGIESPDSEDRKMISELMLVSSETWINISYWAKQTGSLQPWQRSLAHSMSTLASKVQEPTLKQSINALKILEDSRKLGFKIKDEDKLKSEESCILNKLSSGDREKYIQLPDEIKVEYLKKYLRQEKIDEYNYNKSHRWD